MKKLAIITGVVLLSGCSSVLYPPTQENINYCKRMTQMVDQSYTMKAQGKDLLDALKFFQLDGGDADVMSRFYASYPFLNSQAGLPASAVKDNAYKLCIDYERPGPDYYGPYNLHYTPYGYYHAIPYHPRY